MGDEITQDPVQRLHDFELAVDLERSVGFNGSDAVLFDVARDQT